MSAGAPDGARDVAYDQAEVRGGSPADGSGDVPRLPPKVVQPHGGALYRGGKPGNRGGGPLPSDVRRLARKLGAARLRLLARIADGDVTVPLRHTCEHCGKAPTRTDADVEAMLRRTVRPGEQVAAIRELLRVGMGPTLTVDDVRGRFEAQVAVLRDELSDQAPLLERVLARLSQVWK